MTILTKSRLGLISMRFAAVLLVLGLQLSETAWSNHGLQTLTLSTEPAGWTPTSSVIIGDAIPYSIDNSGRVYFTGDLRGNYGAPAGYGIWSYLDGNLTSILRSDAVTEADGRPTNFAGVAGIGAPTPAHVYFFGGVYSDGSGDIREGLWLADGSVAQTIMLDGESLPGHLEEWTGTYPWASASSGGRLLFQAGTRRLDGTEPEWRQSLWLADSDGTLHRVAAESDTLPGLAPPQTIHYIYPDNFALTKRGDAAFFAGYTGTTTPSSGGHGIWMRTVEGDLRPLAKTGDVVDVFGEQVSMQPVSDGPLLNNRRQLLLRGSFESNEFSPRFVDGIWLQDADGSRRLVAHTGLGPRANQSIVFGRFSNVINFTNLTFFLNDHGKIAFPGTYYEVADLAGQMDDGHPLEAGFDGDDVGPVGPSYRQALWTEDNGKLSLVAREGDILPGVDRPLVWAVPVALNDVGQLLFRGSLTAGIPSGTPLETALWAQDRNGGIHLIVKTGGQIDVAPGPELDSRTVYSFQVPLTSNAPGGEVGFNDRGQILLEIEFTDGTRGTFISNAVAVPEPSLAVPVALLAIFIPGRATRRKK